MPYSRNVPQKMSSACFFQELKKQVETAVELEKKLKLELKKKEKDLKTELDKNKVCWVQCQNFPNCFSFTLS